MKTKAILYTSHLALLTLAAVFTFTFSACNDEDDNEVVIIEDPTIDELLSQETTPVTFELKPYHNYIFFDYTDNWKFVGSDTIAASSQTQQVEIDLRQGKHNIIIIDWRSLIWGSATISSADLIDLFPVVFFNTKDRTLYLTSDRTLYLTSKEMSTSDTNSPYKHENYKAIRTINQDVYFWHRPLEVSPYLLPTQKPKFVPVTGCLHIEVTDIKESFFTQEQGKAEIINIPVVEKAGIENDKQYKLNEETYSIEVPSDGVFEYTQNANVEYTGDNYFNMLPLSELYEKHGKYEYFILCPYEGLDDIQLVCNVIEKDGQLVLTKALPAFSFRRGYVTTLRGPLLSGSTSDWTVTMEPYVY